MIFNCFRKSCRSLTICKSFSRVTAGDLLFAGLAAFGAIFKLGNSGWRLFRLSKMLQGLPAIGWRYLSAQVQQRPNSPDFSADKLSIKVEHCINRFSCHDVIRLLGSKFYRLTVCTSKERELFFLLETGRCLYLMDVNIKIFEADHILWMLKLKCFNLMN